LIIALTRAIRKNYDIEWSDNPDFILCGHLGYDFAKYDCVKIACIHECIYPNLNAYDYAILFSTDVYGNRIFHGKACITNLLFKNSYDNNFNRDKFSYEDLLLIKGGGAQVVSNGMANPIRDEFFYKFSEYKQVASGGMHLNNVGGRVSNEHEFLKKYKFSFALEPAQNYMPGEKLLQSFGAHTIPIFFGHPEVCKEYSTKAFVNFYDYVR
jgi:hypothetical protein